MKKNIWFFLRYIFCAVILTPIMGIWSLYVCDTNAWTYILHIIWSDM